MARIPTLDYGAVQTAPLPGARLNVQVGPAAFGAGIAQGLGNLAAAAGSVALAAKAKADDMAVSAAVTNAQAARDDSITNYTALKGHDAIAAADTTTANFRDRLLTIRSGLASKDQQDIYDRNVGPLYVNHNALVKQHELGQWLGLEDSNNKAAHAQSVESASTAVMNGEVRLSSPGAAYASTLVTGSLDNTKALAIKNNHAFAARMAPYLGMPADRYTELADKQSLSDINAAAMDGLVSKGDDQTAAAFMDKYKGEMTADERTKQQARLEPFVFAGEVQRTAAGIVGKALNVGEASLAATGYTPHEGSPEVTPRTLTQMKDDALASPELAKLEASDPKKASAVGVQVRQAFEQAKQSIEAAQGQSFDTIDNAIVNGAPTADLEKQIAAAPVDGPKRRTLLSNLQTRDEGGYTITDPATYDRLMTQSADDPQAFVQRDLRTEKLSRGDRSMFTSQQHKIATEFKTAAGHPLGILSPEEIVNQAASDLYGDETTKERAIDRGNFKAAANAAIVAQEQATGKKVNFEDAKKITDAMTATHVNEHTLLGIPYWGDTKSSSPIQDIPPEDVGKIMSALIRAGRPVTADEIRFWYARQQAASAGN